MIDFAQVTEVRIPQGDVSKITETSSGRVLWEKDKLYDAPRSFMYIARGHKATDFIACDTKTFSYPMYAVYGSADSKLSIVSSLAVGSAVSLSTRSAYGIQEVFSGDKYTACYAEKESEESNIPSSAHKMTDAVWTADSFYLCALDNSGLSLQGYYMNPSMQDIRGKYKLKVIASSPVTFSPLSGSSTQVTSVVNDISSYKAVYDRYKGYDGYRDKGDYPYLYGSLQLRSSSSSFNKLVGATSPENDNRITIFFTIVR